MDVITPATKYAASIRILHWLMAVIILTLLAVGLIMTGLQRDDPLRPLLFSLHKSFGLTILMLLCLRLWFRLHSQVPPLPASIPAYEQWLAHISHWALYGFMLVMPLSGYLLTAFHGMPVKWFGLELPRVVSIDKANGSLAGDVHYYAAYSLMVLLGLHVLGVIKHYMFERLNLLKRMW